MKKLKEVLVKYLRFLEKEETEIARKIRNKRTDANEANQFIILIHIQITRLFISKINV